MQNQPWNPQGPHGYPASQPYAQAANPYGPPAAGLYRQNVIVPHGASSRAPVEPTLRNVKLAMGIGQVVAMVLGIGCLIAAGVMGHDEGSTFAGVGLGCFGLWYLLLCVYGIVNLVWLYQFWSWIPPDQRHTTMWKKYVSPGMAIGFLLVPYFNIYWMFVVYLGIADIMERMRVQYPCSKGSAKTLAIITTVVPMVFFPAGPFLQFMFAKHVEEMAKEMHARMQGLPRPA